MNAAQLQRARALAPTWLPPGALQHPECNRDNALPNGCSSAIPAGRAATTYHKIAEPPSLSPILRRILYTVLFEAFGIVIAGLGLAVLSGAAVFDTGIVAALSSLVAMTWNLTFNTLFEFWETRQTTKGRSFARRAAHALGFELGLTVLLAPLLAWWLDVTLLQAFLYDLTLVVFFVIYTFLFNLAFDKVFGLPASAK